MLALLLFAFISGFVTILAPCIWPILPIVLTSSAVGGKLKPLGVTLGIMLSFSFFLLAISTLVRLFNLDPNVFRIISVIIIAFLGLVLVIPPLSAIVEGFVSKMTSKFSSSQTQGNGFFGGFITGLSLGIIWTPCAGPILATIATLASTGQVSLQIILVTIFYVTGVGLPILLLGYGGQKLVQKTRVLSAYTGLIQQIFGVIMILTAIAIFFNFDKTIQIKLLNLFPQYGNALNSFESSDAVKTQLDLLKGNQNSSFINSNSQPANPNVLPVLGKAPEFVGINKWLNVEKPLSLADLKGKVVLIDFWTYTCINCIRTLPYTTAWYDKYSSQGLVLVGVHTPEFEFEKNSQNVEGAIKQYKIHYPVAQDNDYKTWNAYTNQYWPAEYLIDKDGNVRHVHFGEGEYDKTEQAIQQLLKEANQTVSSDTVKIQDQTPNGQETPETYLGVARGQSYFPNGSLNKGTQDFQTAKNLPANNISLGGTWEIDSEQITSGKNATLDFNIQADKAYLVIHPPASETATVKVYLDGKALDQTNAGDDVVNGIISADRPRLYNLINLKGNRGQHVINLEFDTAGTEAFAFTFG